MATPAEAAGTPLSNSLHRVPAQVQENIVDLPDLDLLWHYACVVSPHSHDAFNSRILRSPPDLPPISPAAHRPSWSEDDAFCSLATFPLASSTPTRPRSLQAFPPLFGSTSMAPYEGSSRNMEDHQKRDALHRVFSAFDENGDGKVDILEISKMLEKLGIESCDQTLLSIITAMSEGHMDKEEFLFLYYESSDLDMNANSSSLQMDVDKELLAAFHIFDKDGNGFISPAELQMVFCSLGFYQGQQLEACVDMIARFDENGDGFVDFFEFKKLFHGENPFLMIQCSA